MPSNTTLNGSFLDAPSRESMNLSFANITDGTQTDDKQYFSMILEKYLDYVAVAPIACVGIVGNFLTVPVFASIENKHAYHWYILFLAVYDLLYCIIMAASIIAKQFQIFWRSYFYYYGIQFASKYISANSYVLVALLSFDRLVSITWPIKSAVWFKERGKRFICIVIGALCIVSLALHTTYLFNWKQEGRQKIANDSAASNVTDDAVLGAGTMDAVWTGMHITNIVCFIHGPILIVLICNVIVIITMRRRMSRMAGLQQGQIITETENNDVTKMMLCMSFVFLFCVVIAAESGSSQNLSVRKFDADDVNYIVIEVWEVLRVVNHSVNFLIYILWTKKYRRNYKEMICCCLKKKDARQ